MRDTGHQAARFLGYVQLQVGAKVFALPVQAAPLRLADGKEQPGGLFFEEGGHLGILVDSDASDGDVRAQIQKASLDAVAHISKKLMN